MQYLLEEGVNPAELKICLDLGSPEALKGAVEAGMGITVISRSIIDKELKLNTLAALQLDPPLSRPFSFVRQRQKFRVTIMEELLEFAQSYFKRNR
eukprot:UN13125